MSTKRQELKTEQPANTAATTNHSTPVISKENQQQHALPRRNPNGNGKHQLTLDQGTKRLAQGLGWFSLGLGLAELLMPERIASIAGVSKKHTGLIRMYGLREIAAGIGIFAQRKPTEAMWSRVAGDALDLGSLGVALNSQDAKPGRIAFATASVLGVTALDLLCAKQLSTTHKGIHAHSSIIINRSPEEVYQFWRNFKNLPRFMHHLESVAELDGARSHWVAKGPAGSTVEWDAEMIADIPGEVITWRSLENADVDNAGAVRFERAAGGRGTIVKVTIEYNPPAGVVGAAVAKLFGEEPGQQLNSDLRRFKQVMELGEVVVSDATLPGTGYTKQRPARPAEPRNTENDDQTVYRDSLHPGFVVNEKKGE